MSAVQDRPAEAGTTFRLIYRSHSLIPEPEGDEELGRILRVSRANNVSRNVTGALMYYDNWFAQVLEGSEESVRSLFDRIKADARHDAVQVSDQGEVGGRVFARWAMAHVGEHGSPDIPWTSTRTGVAEAAAWSPDAAQEAVLSRLRDLTRGYGIGA